MKVVTTEYDRYYIAFGITAERAVELMRKGMTVLKKMYQDESYEIHAAMEELSAETKSVEELGFAMFKFGEFLTQVEASTFLRMQMLSVDPEVMVPDHTDEPKQYDPEDIVVPDNARPNA